MFLTVVVIVVVSAALVAGAAWGVYGALPRGPGGVHRRPRRRGPDRLRGAGADRPGDPGRTDLGRRRVRPARAPPRSPGWTVWSTAGSVRTAGVGCWPRSPSTGSRRTWPWGSRSSAPDPCRSPHCPGRSSCPTSPRPRAGRSRWPRPLQTEGVGLVGCDRGAALGCGAGRKPPAAGVPDPALGSDPVFRRGAVVASLATEVFPKAFKEDSYATGIATALGLVLAVGLGSSAETERRGALEIRPAMRTVRARADRPR